MHERLKKKIELAENNIIEWYEYWEGKVYVAFSGGRDSTVMLHLVRNLYSDVPAVFFNTGLEYPEIVKFVKKFDNVESIRPEIPFHKIVKEYGFPIISKDVSWKIEEIRKTKSMYLRNRRVLEKNKFGIPKKWLPLLAAPFKVSAKCCQIMKKDLGERYVQKTGRLPMIGVMAFESRARKFSQQRFGCNAFTKKHPESRPIMSWELCDVKDYIKEFNIEISEMYTKYGADRTGCMFCGYGIHMDSSPNRFEKMRKTHPKHYDYIINRLGMGNVLDFIGVSY